MIIGMTDETLNVIAGNIRSLMREAGWSQPTLAKAAKVSQGTISHLINPGTIQSPSILSAAKVAGAFKLKLWHLCIPNLPIELSINKEIGIDRLIYCFKESSAEGRHNMLRVAEAEARIYKIQKETSDG